MSRFFAHRPLTYHAVHYKKFGLSSKIKDNGSRVKNLVVNSKPCSMPTTASVINLVWLTTVKFTKLSFSRDSETPWNFPPRLLPACCPWRAEWQKAQDVVVVSRSVHVDPSMRLMWLSCCQWAPSMRYHATITAMLPSFILLSHPEHSNIAIFALHNWQHTQPLPGKDSNTF